MRRRLARLLLRAAGWTTVGEAPRRAVVVGGPHTSNWDFVLTLLVTWSLGASPRVLMKREVFVGPLGWLLRHWGGIPIDRSQAAGVVRRMADEAGPAGAPFLLVIAAEGTRKRAAFWRSGFYRLALDAGLPLSLGFIDGPTRTAGFGPTIQLTGDVAADMDVIRAFFADKHGVRPALRTEPRLKDESPG